MCRVLAIAILLAACGKTHLAIDGGGGDDASSDAAPDANLDPCDWVCHSPVPDGCGPDEICANGLDDNCDGHVDEGCHCPAGAVQSCFRGHPGLRHVGSCVDGQQTCQGAGATSAWGPCEGGIAPTVEACDSVDNDCNGCPDDSASCCVVELACPAPGALADGTPFHAYSIDGTSFYGGTVDAWSWTIRGGPCDDLFIGEGKPPSFSVTGASTSQLTFTPTLSGDYTITVDMTLPGGSHQTCTFIVHVGGPGVRIELCWDATGATDLDLHLHRPGTTTPWFYTTGTTVNPDDCHYVDCKKEPSTPIADWGYAPSPTAGCPPGWPAEGCRNPRLDIDNINVAGVPENINVDQPADGDTFRMLVHYYSSLNTIPPVHPMVNIYCGGHLQATFGAVPDLVDGFVRPAGGGGAATGPMWRVADVTAHVTGGVTTGCTITQLHAPGQTTGYWVATDDSTAY
jgi:hypothetical protein